MRNTTALGAILRPGSLSHRTSLLSGAIATPAILVNAQQSQTHRLATLASRSSVAWPSNRLASRPLSCTALRRQEEQERELDDGEKNIIELLKREFQPATLQVQDVSGGCGSFYAIVIASHKFKGLSTIKAHRMVNETLKEVISGIHGLQLRTMPADDAKMD